jgi:hypothetical protein
MSEHLSALLVKLQTLPSDFSWAGTDAESRRRSDVENALRELRGRQESEMMKLEQLVESGRLDLSQKLSALNHKYDADRRLLSAKHEKQIQDIQASNHT